MKVLLTGEVTQRKISKRPSIESKIVDIKRHFFRNNKGIMGDQKRSIIDSVQQHFESLSPKDAA